MSRRSLFLLSICFLSSLYVVSSFRRNSSPGGAFHRSLHSQCLHSAHLPLDDEHASNDNENKLDLPVWIQTSNRLTVDAIKAILVILIPEDRPFGRFYALETIARVPYFSYTSVLHLYETLGWFRKSEYIKIHFAESWNELHHLKIMESLGGNSEFKDRFIAQHIAFFYYWLVVAVYMASPAVAYDLNKYVERHAYNSYKEFLISHEEELKSQPAPQVAIDYYTKEDLYMFDAFQSDRVLTTGGYNDIDDGRRREEQRRPVIENLYDVFVNIRDDEAEHAETMAMLQRDVSLTSRGKK